MIFVILGTHERPFYRLVEEIDRLCLQDKIKEKVIVQLGFTDYNFKAKNVKAFKYLPQNEFEKYMKKAKILITHGGAGSIMSAVRLGKPVIAVPRREKFGEHADDHQLQIVKEMSKNKAIIPVYEIKELEKAIEKAKRMKVKKLKYEKAPVFRIIEEKLREWSIVTNK
jgi:UDP-N-acetylglucosamine transferase subunit ALG13